jgi:hypothetical protein
MPSFEVIHQIGYKIIDVFKNVSRDAVKEEESNIILKMHACM